MLRLSFTKRLLFSPMMTLARDCCIDRCRLAQDLSYARAILVSVKNFTALTKKLSKPQYAI
jgi:hypothetical protein